MLKKYGNLAELLRHQIIEFIILITFPYGFFKIVFSIRGCLNFLIRRCINKKMLIKT